MILAAALTALVTTASASMPVASVNTVATAQQATTISTTNTLAAVVPTPGAGLLMVLGGLVMARGGRKAKKA
jgi:predicted S18 family serine protease